MTVISKKNLSISIRWTLVFVGFLALVVSFSGSTEIPSFQSLRAPSGLGVHFLEEIEDVNNRNTSHNRSTVY